MKHKFRLECPEEWAKMVVSDLLAPKETLVHPDPLENWALLANPGKQVTMEHQCQDRKGQKDPLGHLDHLDLLEREF